MISITVLVLRSGHILYKTSIMPLGLTQLTNSNLWFKYDLGQKYYVPQVRPDQGSNSQPPDHDSTGTLTPALTTRPSVTSWTTSNLKAGHDQNSLKILRLKIRH